MQPPRSSPPGTNDSLLPPDLVGRDFEGRYRVESRLGAGGIGIVYRAIDQRLNRPVALKVLREVTGSRGPRRRFEREAKALAALAHPNVVTIVDYGVSDGTPYLVMELLDGQTLAEALAADGALAPERAMDIMRQLLLGLGYVHEQGLVHRDIKPGNVFLQQLPELGEHVKLLDFGLAKFLRPDEGDAVLTRAGEIFGTPGYMPPEQWGGEEVDARADVYAIMAVLYEMLAGRKPFVGETAEILHDQFDPPPLLHEANPDRVAHPALDGLFRRALSKDPEQRPASAAVLADELQALPVPFVFTQPEATDSKRLATVRARRADEQDPAASAARAQAAFAPTMAQPAAAHARESQAPFHRLVAGAKHLLRRLLLAGAVTIAVLSLFVIGSAVALIYLLRSPAQDDVQAALENVIRAAQVMAPAVEVGDAGPEADAQGSVAASSGAEDVADAPEKDVETVSAAATPAAKAPPRPRAINPWRRPVPSALAKLRRSIEKGDKGNDRMLAELRRYNREHPRDPRGHLLLARLYMNRSWLNDALSQYEFAVLRDETCRGDPRMLQDMVELAGNRSTHVRARKLLGTVYGSEAVATLQRAMRKADDKSRPLLQQALDQLRGG